MKTYLEHQKFRVWMTDAKLRPDRAWRVVMRYQMLQHIRNWWILGLLIVVAVGTIIGLGVSSVEWAGDWDYATPDGYVFSAIAGTYMAVAAAFILLIGAPMFSEDLRFHAPLFYFSRPLRPIHYLAGKLSVLGGYTVVAALIPVLLFLFMMLVIAVPNADPPTGMHPEDLQRWETSAVNSVGDWAYGAIIVVPGVIVMTAFLIAVTALVSAYTRRFWHAAIGVVVILGGWGMVAMAGLELSSSAWANIGGPFGWYYLMLVLPFSARFDHWMIYGNGFMSQQLDAWFPAMIMAYVIVIALTVLCGWLTLRRLSRQEELL